VLHLSFGKSVSKIEEKEFKIVEAKRLLMTKDHRFNTNTNK
jgi:hypothetical protein